MHLPGPLFSLNFGLVNVPSLRERFVKKLFVLTFFLSPAYVHGQYILDPCMSSVKELGFFLRSDYVINMCEGCSSNFIASDMMQWNGTEWIGRNPYASTDLAPPPGCSVRAIYCGAYNWTRGGEGIALLLDKSLQEGQTYSYTFTYASDGYNGDGNFSPIIYTHSAVMSPGLPKYSTGFNVGRLPATDGWKTSTITFTATAQQRGHVWIILRAYESSGIILGNCEQPLIEALAANLVDSTICSEDKIQISAKKFASVQYQWSTGDVSPDITAGPGVYTLTIKNKHCSVKDTLIITAMDCSPQLLMPNFFSPNGDGDNPIFRPIFYNYMTRATLTVYNRWGTSIHSGDLFTGWDGTHHGQEVPEGVYFYSVVYITRTGTTRSAKGTVTVAR